MSTQIKTGQRDWLSVVNLSFFNHKTFQCTMKNGCTGWGTEEVWYNDTTYFAEVRAYVEEPAGGFFSDFMDNPLNGVIDFSRLVLNIPVTMGPIKGKNGYFRTIATASLDNSNADWGIFTSEGTQHIDTSAAYNGFLHAHWSGSRQDLKL